MFINLTLIDWYRIHGRALPWRCETDPYTIWLSEIILQQTRVTQGLNYFIKFKNMFPTVHDLAKASLDEVLKLWQGLGYYTRARNLHATAKLISEEYNGVFPSTYEELRKLKGIGDYTAAAIVSISYKIPVAVVDGNVLRVLSRIFGIFTPIDSTDGKKEFARLAQSLLDINQPDVYNQAIMDFGALICTPKKAQCADCNFLEKCYAYQNNCVYQLPVKLDKTKLQTRYFNYLVIRYGNYTFIRQRNEKDIWHSLYEFPLIENKTELTVDKITTLSEWRAIFKGSKPVVTNISALIKHQLSHQILWCRFYSIEIEKPAKKLLSDYKGINIGDFEKFSIPRLIEIYMIKYGGQKFFNL
ncbi:MAG: A/G-specific adenine glycosylase [Prevotellaceae bacterium]|jgi:A/G-specific adenine glycosylase|nr:A/G-specific adenine glycosylase [Prevotellaceae bacterium]